VTKPLLEFAAGDFVFREGDRGQDMFIIESGHVSILRNASGPEPIATLGPGDFFGEMSVLEDEPRFASVRVDDAVKLLKIDRASFIPIIRDNAEIAVRIMRRLAERVRRSEERVLAARSQASTGFTAAPEAARINAYKLVHTDTGTELPLPLQFDELMVGRPDPVTGINPEVNLNGLDPKRSLSRRHAKILAQNGRFSICEELGTANGTFVNGEQLTTGEPKSIKVGDKLRFGLVELELKRA
jgi:CRP-like cAMP-binding protein